MKHIKLIAISILIAIQFSVNAQEKKIKFSSGTLKICSSKNFKIKGYDGSEVIIKSLHDKKRTYNLAKLNYQVSRNLTGTARPAQSVGIARPKNSKDTAAPKLFFSYNDAKRREGLKRLGKKQENQDYGIYFTIEEKNGELIFKDNQEEGQL